MELFQRAKAVRLKSHHDKYLYADEDEEHVRQDRNGGSQNARWVVELTPAESNLVSHIRLLSCYRRYLTSSGEPFLLGMTGNKVLQTVPRRVDSSVEWEPIREGFQIKFKTRYGQFLRANGGLPPWRNSVTHDIPHRSSTQDWILWDVDVVEIRVNSPSLGPHVVAAADYSGSFSDAGDLSPVSSPSTPSSELSKQESSSSLPPSPPKKDGRTIYYTIADEEGKVEDGLEQPSFAFKGTDVEELTRRLEEETELSGIVVCSRNPLNGHLYPLRLHLPPNNTPMHVVVLRADKRAKSIVSGAEISS